MKKPNLIIGKKQIILACLTVILGIAIYINYFLSQAGSEIPTKPTDTQSGNYGDATLVNGQETKDYFATARLNKMTSRDEAVETFTALMNGGDLTPEEIASMAQDAVSVAKLVESETKIENLIKAKGFEDCVCYLDGKSADIVVKADNLEVADAATIKTILLQEVSVPLENIKIWNTK